MDDGGPAAVNICIVLYKNNFVMKRGLEIVPYPSSTADSFVHGGTATVTAQFCYARSIQ
jgi:hypothetical protein